MKVLQATEELITNREVLEWLQSYETKQNKEKLPSNLKQLIEPLTKYLQDTPAGESEESHCNRQFILYCH